MPPFAGSLACIEADPFRCGEMLSEISLAFLSGKAISKVTEAGLTYKSLP